MNLNRNNLDDLENSVRRINTIVESETIDIAMLDIIGSDENWQRLLNILKQTKKKNVLKMLKLIESNKKTPLSLDDGDAQLFEKTEVLDLFATLCKEEISKKYRLSELEQMFIAIFGCKPLSKGKNKGSIINSINYYIYREERAKAFSQQSPQ